MDVYGSLRTWSWNYTQIRIFPAFYGRYTDCGIDITTMLQIDLDSLIEFVKKLNPATSFTSLTSTSMNFLDTSAIIDPTDFQFLSNWLSLLLLYSLPHPRFYKDSVPSSHHLRLSRLCFENLDFYNELHMMHDFCFASVATPWTRSHLVLEPNRSHYS